MEEQYARTALLLGESGMERLRRARVAVFGLGGVGGYVAEALARSGVGTLDLVDDDKVSMSNINRQLLATHDTLGRYKVDAAKERIHSIDPSVCVNTYRTFYLPENSSTFDFTQYDYVVDAIDTVTGKLTLIRQAKEAGVPIISCMGTGNKMDPTAFRVADISKTSGCALARIMRKECAKRGLKNVKVVYSQELPLIPGGAVEDAADDDRPGVSSRRATPGSNAFVPGVAGLIAAGEVVKDLVGFKK